MLPEHRSVSQFNQYKRCPLAYKLARIDKVWQRPAAWLVQGSAVHEVADAWEKSEGTMTEEQALELYAEKFAEHTSSYTETTPNFDYWARSGPYAGEADLERRFLLGQEQVRRYIAWRTTHPEEQVWVTDDGTLGSELPFEVDLDGILVRGYIDLVLKGAGDEAIVRDTKTGNMPGDIFQLATYGVAVGIQYGTMVSTGEYWMGKTGKPTFPYDLTEWTRERVTEEFHELEDNLQAGNFPADPEPSKCMFCDVNTSCPVFSA